MKVDPGEALLTEDGHPIGELVLAGGSTPSFPPQSAVEAESREEMLRSEAQLITGSLDADAAVVELYPSYGDVNLRRRAMRLFVVDCLSYQEVAKAVGVPERTVSMWIYTFRWDALVKKELCVQRTQSLLELERIRTVARTKIVREQLKEAGELRRRAAAAVRDGSVSVKSGTEAWAAAAKIEHTITGVSESGAVVAADAEEEAAKAAKDGAGRTPLVMVFQGGLPPIRRSST